MKRIVYRITYRKRPNAAGCHWKIDGGGYGAAIGWRITQAFAIIDAIMDAHNDLHSGRLAQVVLHGKDGRIRWERTYGRDPKRRKG